MKDGRRSLISLAAQARANVLLTRGGSFGYHDRPVTSATSLGSALDHLMDETVLAKPSGGQKGEQATASGWRIPAMVLVLTAPLLTTRRPRQRGGKVAWHRRMPGLESFTLSSEALPPVFKAVAHSVMADGDTEIDLLPDSVLKACKNYGHAETPVATKPIPDRGNTDAPTSDLLPRRCLRIYGG
jgi:hypothetical protein